jgi:hypothetical protein
MTSPRRAFLKQAGLGAAALSSLPSMLAASPAHAVARTPDDLGARALAWHAAEWEQQPPAQTWDTSWTAKVTGKHKAMFDVPEISGGGGVMRAAIWGRQYTDVLKLTPADLSTVIVIRHAAIPLIMNQAFWAEYEVGKEEKLKNDEGKTMKTNPVLAVDDSKPASYLMLDKQIANGAIALACNMAFAGIVSMVAKRDKLKNPEAREKAKSYIVPGVILQPSGIFANVMAEEAGCVFVRAV